MLSIRSIYVKHIVMMLFLSEFFTIFYYETWLCDCDMWHHANPNPRSHKWKIKGKENTK